MSEEERRFQWYVVHTLSGQERKARSALESRKESEEVGEWVGRVLLPTENVSEVKAGKRRVSSRLFYPGYILIEMELNDRTWKYVRGTSGVLGFLGGDKPIPLPADEVDSVLNQMESRKEQVKPKVAFGLGDTVKVTEGPFVNFNGIIDEVNPDKGKLKVMVSIFGRSTPLELEYWQVERT